MIVGHAMSFAKLCAGVCVRVPACVHVHGGIERVDEKHEEWKENEVEWRETRVEFISCSKERKRGGRAINLLRILYMIYEYTRQIVNTKKNL